MLQPTSRFSPHPTDTLHHANATPDMDNLNHKRLWFKLLANTATLTLEYLKYQDFAEKIQAMR